MVFLYRVQNLHIHAEKTHKDFGARTAKIVGATRRRRHPSAAARCRQTPYLMHACSIHKSMTFDLDARTRSK